MRPAVLLFLLTACGTTPPAEYTIDTLPSGVIQVVNHAPSGWADTSGWKLVHDRTIVPPAEGDGSLGMIGSLGVGRDGAIYMFDPMDPVILKFNAEGDFVQRIGRNGDGPGEFRVGMFSIVGDTIAMQDAGSSRMVLFTTDGTPLGEWSGAFRAPDALPVRTDGAIATQVWLRDRAQTDLDQYPGRAWLYHRLDGTVLDTVRTPPVPKTLQWKVENERANFAITVPFAPDREFLLTRSGAVVWGDQAASRLIHSRTGEDTVRIIEFPGSTEVIPDAVRRKAYEEATGMHEWLAGIADLADVPTTYPRWLDIAMDGDRTWLRRPLSDGSYRWQVIDVEGRFLGEVPSPFEPNWRDQWVGDLVYHVATTEDGEPAVEVWRIVR